MSGALLSLALAGCDQGVQGGQGTSQEDVARVEASASATLEGMTRVSFTEGDGLSLAWNESGERFSVLQGAQPAVPAVFSQKEDGMFSGRIIAEVPECFAVYPFLGTTQMQASKMTLDLSRQSGEMDETKTYMWARDVYDGEAMNFEFRHLSAIMKVEMNFPAAASGKTITDVTLTSDELTPKGTVDLTAETPAVTPSELGTIVLSKDFAMEGTALSVYFNIFPDEYMDLSITAATADGQMYNASLADMNVAAGQMVTAEARMMAGSVAPKNVWLVETIVGDGNQGSELGNGTACQVGNGTGIAFVPGSNETKLWFTQRTGGLVRELTLDDKFTVREVVSATWNGDVNVWQGAFNSKGEYFVAHKGKSCILKLNSQTKQFEEFASGINNPMNIAFDKDDNLYVPSRDAKKIIRITPAGEKSDWVATGAYKPNYVAFDAKGNLICGTNGGWVIFQVSPDKTIKPIVGSGVRPKESGMSYVNDGKPGNPLSANVGNSEGIVVGSDGCIYFTDQTDQYCVRKLTPGLDGSYEKGTLTTIAGQMAGGTDDGVGTEARFKNPEELVITKDCRTIYVICSSGNVIKRLTFMD